MHLALANLKRCETTVREDPFAKCHTELTEIYYISRV